VTRINVKLSSVPGSVVVAVDDVVGALPVRQRLIKMYMSRERMKDENTFRETEAFLERGASATDRRAKVMDALRSAVAS